MEGASSSGARASESAGVYVQVAVAPTTAVQWTNPLSNQAADAAVDDNEELHAPRAPAADDDEELHDPRAAAEEKATAEKRAADAAERAAHAEAALAAAQEEVKQKTEAEARLSERQAAAEAKISGAPMPPLPAADDAVSTPWVIDFSSNSTASPECQAAEATSYHQEDPLQAMLAMGFAEEIASDALRSSGGDMDAAIVDALGRSSTSEPRQAASVDGSEVQLPSGWQRRWDSAQKKYYYVDHNRGITQWEQPTVPVALHTNVAWTFAGTFELPSGVVDGGDVGIYLELLMGGDQSTQDEVAQNVASASCKVELVEAVVATLSSGCNAAIRTRAASVLHRLADASSELKDAVVKAGGVSILLDMLGSHETRAAARGALISIASGSNINKEAILAAGGALVALLVQGDHRDKTTALTVFATLLSQEHQHCGDFSGEVGTDWTPEKNRQHSAHCESVVAAGIIAPAMGLVQHGSEGEMDDASAVLMELVRTDDEGSRKDALVGAGAIAPLGQLLTHTSSRSQANAAGIVAHLVSGSDTNCTSRKDTIMNNGVVAPLVMLLSHGDDQCKNNATAALACLSRGADHRKDVLMTVGVVPALVSLVKAGDMYSQASAAYALSVLAAGQDVSTSEHRKDSIVAAGAVTPLVMLLQHGTLTGRETAASALSNLVNDVHEHRKNVVFAAGAVAPLVQLLIQGTIGGKTNAAAVLAFVARNGIMNKGSDATAPANRKNAIVEAGAVGPLMELLIRPPEPGSLARQDSPHGHKHNSGYALSRLITGKDAKSKERLHAVAQELLTRAKLNEWHRDEWKGAEFKRAEFISKEAEFIRDKSKVQDVLDELAGIDLRSLEHNLDSKDSEHNSTSCCVMT